jgi:inward rectifier potassium channel
MADPLDSLPRPVPGGDDLGLGTQGGSARSVNKDGSFNLRRVNQAWFRPYELYHQMITMGLGRFALVLAAGNLAANLVFAGLYLAIGMEHFDGTTGATLGSRFQDAYFFSAQTLTTVGNGRLHPVGALSSALASLESLLGLLGFALACGLVYGRFSRPHARILFSRHALVAPYRDGTGFMFRIVNERSNELIEAEAHITLSLRDPETGVHHFHQLDLERRRINLFPSNWTIVHPVGPESPLAGLDTDGLRAGDAEFIVLIKAFDDTFAQHVFARSSYKAGEILWDWKFAPMTTPPGADGMAEVDLARLDALEPLAGILARPDPSR